MESELYNQEYFDYQKKVGEFGGVANLFKFCSHVSTQDSVLDFGSGGGYLLKQIRARRKLGVEVNLSAREHAAGIGIASVATLKDVPDNYASLVISNHALEHVDNPCATLSELLPKVRTGGKLVFVVPHEGVDIEYDAKDPNHHLYTWNQMTLGNLFRRAGYSVESVEAIQHKWPPNYLEIYEELGEVKFHEACRNYAKEHNAYQIRIVASKR